MLRWLVVAAPALILASLLIGPDGGHPWSIFADENSAILKLRAWRTALGSMVGASLAVSGAVMQAVLLNPLAEPYILGVSAGAGLGTAMCLAAGGFALGFWIQPAGAFLGSLASLFVVYRLARVGRRSASPTVILAGVVWGSLCGSVLMFIASQSSAQGMHTLMWWFLGDLQVLAPELVIGLAAVNGPVVAALVLWSRRLDVMALGSELPHHLGLPVERTRWVMLSAAALLASTCVAVSGLIGFVGLIIPHAARALVGPEHRRLLPAAAALGASFLCLADAVGRTMLYPAEVPAGIITSLAGAPFFLFLLRQRQKQMWI